MSSHHRNNPGRDPLEDLAGRRRQAAAPVPAAPPVTDNPYAAAYAVIADVAVALASTTNLTDILNQIVDGIIQVTGCERGFVLLRGRDGEFSAFTGRYANARVWDEDDARAISETVRNRVVDTREVFTAGDLQHMDEFKGSQSIQAGGIMAAVCLPLLYKDELIGVIYADSTHLLRRSLEGSQHVLGAFGVQASFAIERARNRGEVLTAPHPAPGPAAAPAREFRLGNMVSRDPAMDELYAMVEKIAPGTMTVLIQGESGTGKDLLAQAIHVNSPRAQKPFITVNAAGMHDELVSSILFGHKRGAFTGAIADREGLFERAEGGTLFLDEVGDMPLATQIKLLRVIENREMSRLGEEGVVHKVDVRVIAATHRDLAASVLNGSFREDLLVRLRVAPVYIPPLRDRRGDIIPLAAHFLARYAREHGIPTPELSREARARLLANPWVGNVRALRNVIELSIAFRDENNVIHADAVDRYFKDPVPRSRPAETGGTWREQMDRHEAQVVRRALEDAGYNKSKAAKALDLSRQQLHHKINKFNIVTPDD